jgi:hypothetical protein
VAVAVAIGTWRISQNRYIAPLEEQVANLEERLTERGKILRDLSDVCKPSLIEQIHTSYKSLESHLAECQSNLKQGVIALEGWNKQNSALQKTVKSYENNCSIISEIRNLYKNKTTIDSWRTESGHSERAYETWKHQSADYQASIIIYQQKLACEPQ